jgi:NADH-quinone oxidoreductase subunit A
MNVDFKDAREKFEIRFFLVGILFIIFDLELSLIMPFTLILSQLPLLGTGDQRGRHDPGSFGRAT